MADGQWILKMELLACTVTTISILSYLLYQINKNIKAKETLGKVLLPIVKLDPRTVECNTVLPLPIGAEICSHSMEIITNQTIKTQYEEKAIVILQCSKCGVIDKTIVATSPLPPPSKSECKHTWIKEKTVTLDSAFEQMEELLKNKNNKEEFSPSKAPSWMFKKTTIRERICSKCGDIDKTVASNFDESDEAHLPEE